MSGVKHPRAYHSPVREEQARRTRAAVVAAARRLFLDQGYSGTSLAAVASAAGVARPTVFAVFGSKQALLREILDNALAGDDEPVAVSERPWFRPVWEANTPEEALEAYAEVCTLLGHRAADIVETVRQATDASADAKAAWDRLQSNRRAGAEMVLRHVRKLGPLQVGLNHRAAVDVLWFWNDLHHYTTLVTNCSWSEKHYSAWLGRQMRQGLL